MNLSYILILKLCKLKIKIIKITFIADVKFVVIAIRVTFLNFIISYLNKGITLLY